VPDITQTNDTAMKLKNRRDLSLCARPGKAVRFFVIHEIEKQCDKQSDAPHEPPSPILFPDCGDNKRHTACTHTKPLGSRRRVHLRRRVERENRLHHSIHCSYRVGSFVPLTARVAVHDGVLIAPSDANVPIPSFDSGLCKAFTHPVSFRLATPQQPLRAWKF
jgi:hypothetical protein